jgi:hypothetical protein
VQRLRAVEKPSQTQTSKEEKDLSVPMKRIAGMKPKPGASDTSE